VEWEGRKEMRMIKGEHILGNTISGTSAKFATREIPNPDGIPGALFAS